MKRKQEATAKAAEAFSNAPAPRRIAVKAAAPPVEQVVPASAPSVKSAAPDEEVAAMADKYPHADRLHSLLLVPLCLDNSSQFEGKQAAKILAKELVTFLVENDTPSIRVRLLNSSAANTKYAFGDELAKYMRALHKKNGLPEDERFSHQVVEWDSLTAEDAARFVVCPVTWRFKASHPITRQVAASVLAAAKQRYLTASCGKGLLLWIPEGSLFLGAGQALLLVNGPNMHNQMKPNCLEGDYTKGAALLHACYHSIFQSFAEAVASPE